MKGLYIVLLFTILTMEAFPHRIKRENGLEDKGTQFRKISEIFRKYRRMFSSKSKPEKQEMSTGSMETTDFPSTEFYSTKVSELIETTVSNIDEINLTSTADNLLTFTTKIPIDETASTEKIIENFKTAANEFGFSVKTCSCTISPTGSTEGCSSGETISTTSITSSSSSSSQFPSSDTSAPTETTETTWTATSTISTAEQTTDNAEPETTVPVSEDTTPETETTEISTTISTKITEETVSTDLPTTTEVFTSEESTETTTDEITTDLDTTTDSVTNTANITGLPFTNVTDTTDFTTESDKFMDFDFLVLDRNTGIYCTLCKMAITLTVPYKRNDGTTAVLELHVPRTARVRGLCGKKDSWMTLSWAEERDEQTVTDIGELNNVSFVFVNNGKTFSVASITVQVWLNKDDAHDSTAGRRSARTSTGLGLFSASLKSGIHTCEVETKVKAGDIGLSITGVSLIAFNEQNDISSRTGEPCPVKTGVNIATRVGFVFAGIIIIFVIVLFIWRKKKASRIRAELP